MFGFWEAVHDASEPTEVGNSNAGHENFTEILEDPESVGDVVEHFIARVKETQKLPLVFQMARGKRPIPRFLVRVLRTLLMSEDVSKPLDLVRTNWSLIRRVLPENKEDLRSVETFLKRLPQLDNLVTEVAKVKWTQSFGQESRLVKLESSTPIHCQAGTSSGVRLTSDWCTWFLPSSNTWAGVL